jgi:hypothetical protein
MFHTTGGSKWQTIVVVQVISLKTVKEHQKQVVKVASTAGGISKMILSAPQRLVKKGAKVAMVAAAAVSVAATW